MPWRENLTYYNEQELPRAFSRSTPDHFYYRLKTSPDTPLAVTQVYPANQQQLYPSTNTFLQCLLLPAYVAKVNPLTNAK